MISSECVVVAAFATVSVVTGLICQYPPCELVKCEMVDPENCNGTMKMGGGYCGCCLACFTTLELGENCENKDHIDVLYYPPTAVCDTGLYCERNGSTCEPIPGYNHNFG